MSSINGNEPTSTLPSTSTATRIHNGSASSLSSLLMPFATTTSTYIHVYSGYYGNNSHNYTSSSTTYDEEDWSTTSRESMTSLPSAWMQAIIWLNVVGNPIVIVVGLTGNGLCLLVVLGSHLRRQSTTIYLAFLSMVDSVFLLTLVVNWLAWIEIPLINRPGWCQATIYLAYISSFVSAWTVVCFTAERWVVVFHPLRRAAWCNPRRTCLALAICCLVAFILYSFSFWTIAVRSNKVDGDDSGGEGEGYDWGAENTSTSSTSPSAIVEAPSEVQVCLTLPKYVEVIKVMTIVDSAVTFVAPFSAIAVLNACIACRIWVVVYRRRNSGILMWTGGGGATSKADEGGRSRNGKGDTIANSHQQPPSPIPRDHMRKSLNKAAVTTCPHDGVNGAQVPIMSSKHHNKNMSHRQSGDNKDERGGPTSSNDHINIEMKPDANFVELKTFVDIPNNHSHFNSNSNSLQKLPNLHRKLTKNCSTRQPLLHQQAGGCEPCRCHCNLLGANSQPSNEELRLAYPLNKIASGDSGAGYACCSHSSSDSSSTNNIRSDCSGLHTHNLVHWQSSSIAPTTAISGSSKQQQRRVSIVNAATAPTNSTECCTDNSWGSQQQRARSWHGNININGYNRQPCSITSTASHVRWSYVRTNTAQKNQSIGKNSNNRRHYQTTSLSSTIAVAIAANTSNNNVQRMSSVNGATGREGGGGGMTSRSRSTGVQQVQQQQRQSLYQLRANDRLRKTQTKATKTLLIISTAFLIFNLPSHVIRLLLFQLGKKNDAALLWQHVFQLAAYINYSSNFFLYAVLSQSFRAAARWQLQRMRKAATLLLCRCFCLAAGKSSDHGDLD